MTDRNTSVGQEYLTPGEAAKRLNVSTRTLWRYQAEGRITPRRLPSGHRRFLVEDVDRLLQVAS